MKTTKTANIVFASIAVILALIALALIVFSAQTACVSSRYVPPVEEQEEITPPKKDDILQQGDLTEVWFDELFAVYYPKQLADIYPTRAVVYGNSDTKQPPFCFCSEKITDIEIFSVENGKRSGEPLESVEYLEPMEAIILKVELSEVADIGISFKDKNGKSYSYGICRNADDSAVVLTELK